MNRKPLSNCVSLGQLASNVGSYAITCSLTVAALFGDLVAIAGRTKLSLALGDAALAGRADRKCTRHRV